MVPLLRLRPCFALLFCNVVSGQRFGRKFCDTSGHYPLYLLHVGVLAHKDGQKAGVAVCHEHIVAHYFSIVDDDDTRREQRGKHEPFACSKSCGVVHRATQPDISLDLFE